MIVATDTFRRAKNGPAFWSSLKAVLGFPIEIISGLEEARLIHKGVSHDFPSTERRLIIDIGGGSTELIVSDAGTALHLASLKMGCVSWSKAYFSNGWTEGITFVQRHRLCPQTNRSAHSNLSKFWMDRYMRASGTIKALEALAIELNHPHLNHLALKANPRRDADREQRPSDSTKDF